MACPNRACTTHHACTDLLGSAEADGQLPVLKGPLHVDFGGEEMGPASEPQRVHMLTAAAFVNQWTTPVCRSKKSKTMRPQYNSHIIKGPKRMFTLRFRV